MYHLFRLTPGRYRNALRGRLLRLRSNISLDALLERGDVVLAVGTPNPSFVQRVVGLMGSAGALLIVEANEDACNVHRKHIAEAGYANVQVVQLAAYSEQTTLRFAIANIPGNSKIAELETTVDTDFRADNEYVRYQEVEADTVDNILAAAAFPNPAKMFVTVNGAEYEVVKGAKATLAGMGSGSTIFVKAHAQKSQTHGTIFGDIRHVLVEAGFTVIQTKPSRSTAPEHPDWPIRGGDAFGYKR